MNLRAMLKDKESTAYQVFDLVRFVLICLAVVIPVRIFIAQPFIVDGASMEPTIETGEYFIVDRISYRIKEPQRGDVIVIRPPSNQSTFFIKRLIGLPGETVRFEGDTVVIVNEESPEGIVLDEPYISRSIISADLEIVLGEDEFYVMGDNRPSSQDSRYFGALRREDIVGRAWLRLFPLNQAKIHPGDYRDQYVFDNRSGDDV